MPSIDERTIHDGAVKVSGRVAPGDGLTVRFPVALDPPVICWYAVSVTEEHISLAGNCLPDGSAFVVDVVIRPSHERLGFVHVTARATVLEGWIRQFSADCNTSAQC